MTICVNVFLSIFDICWSSFRSRRENKTINNSSRKKHLTMSDWSNLQNQVEILMEEKNCLRRQRMSNTYSKNSVMGGKYTLDVALWKLREFEEEFLIVENFLQDHKTNPTARETVLRWMVGFHSNLKGVNDETLHISITLMDRYLQENREERPSLLQLVALSTLWIASKYLGNMDLEVEDLIFTYSGRPILKKAVSIMEQLDFALDHPISLDFLTNYNDIAGVTEKCHFLGQYILELALLKHEMSPIKPSLQAAAACCLSMGILREVMYLSEVWTPVLITHTGYEIRDFQDLLVRFSILLVKGKRRKYANIRKKYGSPTYAEISLNPLLNGSISFQFIHPEHQHYADGIKKRDNFNKSSVNSPKWEDTFLLKVFSLLMLLLIVLVCMFVSNVFYT
ncbi:G2/mitotic-specific cyclin-B2-like isoform X2 [Leptinotarsa decemlineata]|uniref:G2/mitotic-specific cyclin-B2-like isoform X2 n=1 Tax=Leptinotarsa decemlineata TaxID=7539 RepID=UPI003D30D674